MWPLGRTSAGWEDAPRSSQRRWPPSTPRCASLSATPYEACHLPSSRSSTGTAELVAKTPSSRCCPSREGAGGFVVALRLGGVHRPGIREEVPSGLVHPGAVLSASAAAKAAFRSFSLNIGAMMSIACLNSSKSLRQRGGRSAERVAHPQRGLCVHTHIVPLWSSSVSWKRPSK